MDLPKSLVVAKFGGSSITSLKFGGVVDYLRQLFPHRKVICTLSAGKGATDELISDFREFVKERARHPTHLSTSDPKLDFPIEYDLLLSQGEIDSIWKASVEANFRGIKAVPLCGWQAGIQTNNSHTQAKIALLDPRRITTLLIQYDMIFVAGFQGVSQDGYITTLGRGASDLTAVAIAAALQLPEVFIFTDVDGMGTVDPRRSPRWSTIESLSYAEALELATFGNKVIQNRAVALAQKYCIDIHIKNSARKDGKYTTICSQLRLPRRDRSLGAIGISVRDDIALFTVHMINKPGMSARLLSAMAEADVVPHHVCQGLSAGRAEVSFVADRDSIGRVIRVLRQLCKTRLVVKHSKREGLAELSLVNTAYKESVGQIASVELTLQQANVQAIALFTTGIRITVIIEKEHSDRCLTVLHEKFIPPAPTAKYE